MQLIDVKNIQRRLHKLGFNPGPVDGVKGRMTANAVMRFQESRGLVADGIVGPATFGALFGAANAGEAQVFETAPWYDEACRLIGLKENPARGKSNRAVLQLAEAPKLDYDEDDIPWCGLFVAHCVAATLPAEGLPSIPLRARAWEGFGDRVDPQIGAVMVFWRKSKASGLGHVGFYFGEDDDSYHILGGNQSNMVNIRRLDRERFLSARWPLTALSPTGATMVAEASGIKTTNEA